MFKYLKCLDYPLNIKNVLRLKNMEATNQMIYYFIYTSTNRIHFLKSGCTQGEAIPIFRKLFSANKKPVLPTQALVDENFTSKLRSLMCCPQPTISLPALQASFICSALLRSGFCMKLQTHAFLPVGWGDLPSGCEHCVSWPLSEKLSKLPSGEPHRPWVLDPAGAWDNCHRGHAILTLDLMCSVHRCLH